MFVDTHGTVSGDSLLARWAFYLGYTRMAGAIDGFRQYCIRCGHDEKFHGRPCLACLQFGIRPPCRHARWKTITYRDSPYSGSK